MLMKLYRFIRSTCIITYYAHLQMLMHGWIYLILWRYVTLHPCSSVSQWTIYGPRHQGTVNSSKLVLLEQSNIPASNTEKPWRRFCCTIQLKRSQNLMWEELIHKPFMEVHHVRHSVRTKVGDSCVTCGREQYKCLWYHKFITENRLWCSYIIWVFILIPKKQQEFPARDEPDYIYSNPSYQNIKRDGCWDK